MPQVFFAGLGLVLAGGIAALVMRGGSGRLFALLVASGCVLFAVPAVSVLAGGASWSAGLASALPGGPWSVGIDALSAFFLVAIALVGATASLYGSEYLRAERSSGSVASAHALVASLIVALALVVTARAAIPFLIAWEVMAISAFLLIMFEHEEPETRRAGLIYLVAAHAATLALIGMFAVWRAPGLDLSFASLALPVSSPGVRTAVLLLALAGFGVKAGFVPLHFWLPGAHAAAPSHVSALLSGLVIKSGIYGLLRVIALMGGAPAWFGWSLFGLGVGSGVLGVVWALAQHDIKRLLAYHSVENIGIILVGMGVGVLGDASGFPVIAALGYAGAILHVLNHAVFKGLLFLGAGAIGRATGTRSLDAQGGLGRRMPVTWLTFLTGSAAIVGLPPLNGFVSEWLIVLAMLRAGLAPGAVRGAVFGVAAFGLMGGLALACFTKVNGVVFLGRARTAAATAAREVGPALLVSMVALASVCLLIGVLAVVIVPPALAAARVLTGELDASVVLTSGPGWVSAAALALTGLIAATLLVYRAAVRGKSRLVEHTWGCGYPDPTPRMQYTAASFAAPVLEPFGGLSGIDVSDAGPTGGHHARDATLEGVIVPAWHRLLSGVARANPFRLGRLHVSLLFVFATVVALLWYLAVNQSS